MIHFHDINQFDFNGIHFVAQGDGTDTHLNLNLSKAPWKLQFGGIAPSAANVTTQDALITATGTLSVDGSGDTLLAITFDPAPEASEKTGVNVTFVYYNL